MPQAEISPKTVLGTDTDLKFSPVPDQEKQGFLSWSLVTLGECTTFEDVQMILLPYFEFLNSF